MAKWTPDVKFIASIYPGTLDPIALNHGPNAKMGTSRRTVYRLTPVTREKARTKPCVIEVADSFENVLNIMGAQMGEKYMAKPVDSTETVAVLLKHWTGNMVGVPPGATPGIIEIANSLPTQADFAELFERQTAYANWLYQEGERLNRENNWKEITGAMRIMAEWLDPNNIPMWASPARVTEMIPCPACGEMIAPKVSVCRHCHTVIRALPKDLALLNQREPTETSVA